MSTTVDERVVEMRFDNDQFESNVNESMSTLAKLKQSLKLTGASKGLEAVNTAAKKVNFTPIVNGMDNVVTRFSHAQMTIQHQIDRWADRIVGAAERAIKALTIDPVKTGFQEYETQINSVQTILANTKSKGSTIDDVNQALKELNEYADKTIYNFTEMTRNIGTFTAAGVDLDTSTNAIKGIANLAAMSGSTSQQASTAMYQLSQALASGTVKLMDWNSVVNAQMGGELFQNAIKETARVHGVAIDDMIESEGSFRETLKDGWLTSEILTETLQKFTMTTEGLTEEQIEANRQMLKAKGYTEDQIKAIFELGNDATAAATKVKTLTQLWDVLKEAAQSGWAESWKTIFGDFEQAKAWLSPVAETLANIIGAAAKFRNAILDKAFNNPFANAIKSIKGVTDSIGTAVATVLDYEKVVDEIISGKWGNGEKRWRSLTQAGYDWAHAQNLVNEKLGNSYRRATDYKEAQDKVTESTSRAIEELIKYDDAKLKDLDYNDEQIKALRLIERQSKITGHSIADIYENPDLISGRTLLLDSFKNTGKAIMDVFAQIKGAWNDVFHGENATEDDIINKRAMQIYDVISAIRDFTNYLEVNDETADKLRRTFKGLFAIIDIVTTLVGGGFKIAFKVVKSILGLFDMDILDLTARIGDAIVSFRDWIDSVLNLDGAVQALWPILKNVIKLVKGFIEAALELPFVQTIIQKIAGAFDSLKSLDLQTLGSGFVDIISKWSKAVKDFVDAFLEIPQVQKIIDKLKEKLQSLNLGNLKQVGINIIEGLKNGLGSGFSTVIQWMKDLGLKMLDAICEVLDIHSPSRAMFDIGVFIIQGLIDGIAFALKFLLNGIKKVGSTIIDFFKSLDFSAITDSFKPAIDKFKEIFDKFDFKKLLAIIPILIALKTVKSMFGIIKAATNGINSLNDLIGAFAGVGEKIQGVLGALKWRIIADTIKQLAIALAIIVGSVIALSLVNPENIWRAVAVVVVLSIALAALAIAANKMSESSAKFEKGKIQIDGLKSSLLAIGAAVALLAVVAKILGEMDPTQLSIGMGALAAIMLVMVGLLFVVSKLKCDVKTAATITKLGSMMQKLAIAMLMMILVCKLVAKLDPTEIKAGIIFTVAFTTFVLALAAITKLVGQHADKLGGTLIKLSIAMMLMVVVCKLAGKLSPDEMKAGVKFALGFLGFIALLALINKIGKNDEITKFGRMLLGISVSMILMVAVCKLVAKLTPGEIIAGIATMAVFIVFIKFLTKVTTITNEQQSAKLAGTILAIAVAIAALAVVAVLLGMIPLPMLAKGIGAVAALGVIMALMIWACRGANDIHKSLWPMVAAIAVMAIAIGALSAIERTKLAAATASIGTLMVLFMVLIKVSKKATEAYKSILLLMGVVALLTVAILLIGQLHPQNALAAAGGLALLMASFAVSLKIISTVKKVSLSAMAALLVMVGIAYLLGQVLKSIQTLPAESTLANAKAISLLVISLSASCILLGVAGLLAQAALPGLALLAIVVVAIGALMVAIGKLASDNSKLEDFLNKGLPLLEKIGYGVGAFIGNIVKGFGEAVMSLLPKLAENLSLFMEKLSGFLDGARNIKEDVILGVTYLTAAILELTVASFISGVTTLGGVGLVALGNSLTDFANASSGFFEAVKALGPEACEGAKNLATAILAITVADMIEGIKRFVGGGDNSMSKFAEQIVPFGKAMAAFSSVVTGKIDEGAVTAAANAGKAIAEMQNELYGSGGLKQDIFGEKDLTQFSAQLLAFGGAIVAFSAVVKGKIDEGAVTAAANAGKTIAELQKELYGVGGLKQDIFGEKDLGVFGTQLKNFGTAIVKFSKTVANNIDSGAVEAAANAGKTMAALQNELPTTDGVMQDIFGGKADLGTFGSCLEDFGDSLVDFSDTIVGNLDDDAIKAAANAGTLMADVQDAIPSNKWLDGKVSLEDFGKTLVEYGKKLVDYSDEVEWIDNTSVNDSLTATKTLVEIAKSLQYLDAESAVLDMSAIETLGTYVKNFYDSLSGVTVSTFGSVVDVIGKLRIAVTNMDNINLDGVEKFKSAIETISNINIGDLASTFNNSADEIANIGSNIVEFLSNGISSEQGKISSAANSVVSTLTECINNKSNVFGEAAKQLMTTLINGIAKFKTKASDAIDGVVKQCLATVRNQAPAFTTAGSNLVDGFANGISANSYKAVAQAKAMAEAAEQAAKEALGINSPSKVFYSIGDYTGQGFINALAGYAKKAYRSATDMGNSAKSGLNDALNKAYDIIHGDLETQPTIRPVLDLSSIEAGTSRMNGLLNGVSNVGVTANMNAIGSMMDRRRQNGSNADVVSAIDKLRNGLDNMGSGTTYQINGVTYDDGSNIANAVETIARAALRERRT